ncbi:MAG TPA: hypothetical protein PKA64_26155 [Myxococcota bacterium]|nr:hypothetical protein [Myxococcota bacterium]
MYWVSLGGPTSGADVTWSTAPQGVVCAEENGSCTAQDGDTVDYGAPGRYVGDTPRGRSGPVQVACVQSAFGGDPWYGDTKPCFLQPGGAR